METVWSDNDILAMAALIATEAVSLFAAGHAVMTKRDPKAAAGWAALSLLSPVLGALLYWLFGVNRIEKKARKIYRSHTNFVHAPSAENDVPPRESAMPDLAVLTSKVSPFPLRAGNSAQPLINGEQAYPKMLKAIREAKESVYLSSYIFDNDAAGREFVRELKAAGERGVNVRVLIDDIGARYSFPGIMGRLKGKNLQARRFHRVLLPWLFNYSQLRSHRKILLADAEVGFIGGMNIRLDHMLSQAPPKKRTQDLQFLVRGPVLRDLFEVFAQDWRYTTGENLPPAPGVRKSEGSPGDVAARAVPNNPQEEIGQHRWTLLGALSAARHRVLIITPYFLPDQELLSALGAAAMRGVRVEIILPQKNNHALAHWACIANIWQVLETGCEVWLSKPPFDHSKLMTVDDKWSFIGSSNWDARSFRLNFELNLECHGEELARALSKIFEAKMKSARPLTAEDVNARGPLTKFRDALARLFIPYL